MTCADYRHGLVELARGTDPADEPILRAHVAECASCAAWLTREQSLSAALRGLAENAASERAPDALEQRLVTMFEAGRTPATPPQPMSAARWWLPIAAGLVLAAGSVAWWRGGTTEPVQPPTTVSPPAPVQASVVPPAASPSVPPDVSRSGIENAGRRPASALRPPRVFRPIGFVAIPTAAGLPDFESGEIVRTRIPVSSLPFYGVEITPDAPGTPVEADLLIGQDGQARAIRLVTSDSRNTRSRQ